MHKTPAITVALLLIVAIAGYFFWQKNSDRRLNNPSVNTPIESSVEEPLIVNTDPVLPISTPKEFEDTLVNQASNAQEPNQMTSNTPNVVTPKKPIKPLPKLEESDNEIKAIAEQFSNLAALFIWKNFIHHFVVTIDNIPNKKLPMRYKFTQPLAGKFSVILEKNTDTIVLDSKNYQRYEHFFNVLNAIELEKLTPHYQRFYTLFQQAYEDLGYPNRRFHDRFLQVIKHLQNTPETQEPIHLIRPKVFYQFKSLELESLSAGQKIMLRIGPENRQKAKSKLKELRIILESLPL